MTTDKPKDGGPAFPFHDVEFKYITTTQGLVLDRIPRHFLGMTLRDYFAGQALSAVYTACDLRLVVDGKREDSDDIARAAYRIADAMIAAREGR